GRHPMTSKAQSSVRRRCPLNALPVLRILMSEWRLWRDERNKPRFGLALWAEDNPESLPFPIDMSPLLALPFGVLDGAGVPYNTRNGAYGGAYQPTSIAQYGLAHWNAYLKTGADLHLQAFL